METKKLYMTIYCEGYFYSEIDVPANMTLDEAYDYANEHIDEIPVGELEYIDGSAEISDEDYHFSDWDDDDYEDDDDDDYDE